MTSQLLIPPVTQHRRRPGLTTLLEVALELGHESDLDRILEIATRGVCDAVGCERASLFFFQPATDELLTRVVTELEIAEIRHPIDRGIAGWVARHRQLQVVPDPQQDPRWDASVDRRTGFRTRNILAAPVLSLRGGSLLGVLQLLNKRGGFDHQDEQLIEAFAGHVASALERSRLEAEALLAAEFRQTLEMGRQIQTGFLPTSLPDITGYDVAHWWQPAEYVSGDYHDWFPLNDAQWGFAIGDVSGHGLAASLIMASVRAMVRVLAETTPEPLPFVQLLRRSIEPDLHDGRFLTFVFAALDPATHRLSVVNAGHAPAFHWSCRTDGCETMPTHVLPLGFPNIPLPQETPTVIALEPGDLFVLATDGIIECRNADDQMFGSERLQQLVRAHAHQSSTEIVAAVRQAVHDFCGCSSFCDDTTLVILKRRTAKSG